MKKFTIYGINNTDFYDVRDCDFAYSEEEKNEIVAAFEKKFPHVEVEEEEVSFWTGSREGGELIDEFETREEAEQAIKGYEEADRKEGTFSENFYEVFEREE